MTSDSYVSIGPLGSQVEEVQYHPPNASWPSVDVMRTMPFDYLVHDSRYEDASPVYCPGFKLSPEGTDSYGGKIILMNVNETINKEISISHLPKLVTTFTLFTFLRL